MMLVVAILESAASPALSPLKSVMFERLSENLVRQSEAKRPLSFKPP